MRRPGVSLVSPFVCMALAASTALAQDPGKRQRADELFEQARKQLNEAGEDKTKVAAACEKFGEAIKLDPEAPGTMLNLGLCNEKLERYKTALYWFRKAQVRAAETDLPEYERAAKDHTVDLAKKVATIRIAFSTPPPDGTRVKIDGEEVAPGDYLRAEVDPGKHTLVAGAPGHKIVTQEFEVVDRGGQTIDIQLVAGDNAVIVDRGAGRRKGAIILAAGGAVLWGAAAGISYWAKGRYDIYAMDGRAVAGGDDGGKYCSASGCTIEEATKGANHYQKIARWVATPIFVGGALAIGGAIVMYVTAPSKERVDQTVFAPIVTPDQLGFAITRGF
jgi:tetratricopeptide (TPR) repeat protein